jgi:hypothetical protein
MVHPALNGTATAGSAQDPTTNECSSSFSHPPVMASSRKFWQLSAATMQKLASYLSGGNCAAASSCGLSTMHAQVAHVWMPLA